MTEGATTRAALDRRIDSLFERLRGVWAIAWSRPFVVHLVSLVVAAAVLLYATRNQWFFFDEWDPIANRRGLDGLLLPHNEHPFILPQLCYQLLLRLFGLRTYLPFILLLIVLLLVLVHLLWRLALRVGIDPMVATAVTFLFAVLGVASENLLWAFQASLVGSLTFGVAALLLSDHDGPIDRRDWAAVLMATLAWMWSGVGLTMILVVVLAALIRRRWSAAAVLAAVPLGTYGLWVIGWGGAALESTGAPVDMALGATAYAINGFSGAYGRFVGFDEAGPVVVAFVLLGVAAALGRRVGAAAPVVASLAGAMAFLLLVGFRRSGLGLEQSEAPRYVHVVACLSVLAVALAVDHALKLRPVIAPAAALFAVVVLGVQMNALDSEVEIWSARSAEVRNQILDAAERVRAGETFIAGAQVDPQWAPDLDGDELADLVRRDWLPARAGDGRSALELTNNLQIGVLPTDQDVIAVGGVQLLGVNGAAAEPQADGCIRVTPGASNATVSVAAPDGGAAELRSDVERNVSVQTAASTALSPLSTARPMFVPEGSSDLVLTRPGTVAVLTLPDVAPLELCRLVGA